MTAINPLRQLTTRLRFVYGARDRAANNQYNAATQRTRATVNGLAAANAKLAATQSAVNSAFAGSVKALGGYAAILGLAFGGREIVQASDQMDELNNRLRAVVGNVENIEDLRRSLTRLSVTNFSNIEDTAQIFQRFKIGTEDVGASTEAILEFTDSVQKAAALSGANAQETNNALIQFAQGIASNRFSGEELRSVSEQLPTLLRVLKRDLNLTTGELRELAFAGGLTSDVIFNAFENQRETILQEFSRIQVTQQKAAQNLRTGLFTFFGKFGQGLGVNRVLADLYQGIAEGLIALEDAAFKIGLAFRGAARMLFDFQDAVFSVFNPLFGAVGNTGLGDFLRNLRDFFSVFNTFRASGMGAGEAFKESLGLFFSPETAETIRRVAQSLVAVGKVLLLISAAKIVRGLAAGIGSLLGVFAGSRGGGKGLLKMVAAFFSMSKALTAIKTVGLLLMRAVFSPITAAILALQVAFAAWNKENSNLKKLWEKLVDLWNGGPNGIGLGAIFEFLARVVGGTLTIAFNALVYVVDGVAGALLAVVNALSDAYDFGKKIVKLGAGIAVKTPAGQGAILAVGQLAGVTPVNRDAGLSLAERRERFLNGNGGNTIINNFEIKAEDVPKAATAAEKFGQSGLAGEFRRYSQVSN